MQTTSSKRLKRTAAVVGPWGTEDLEREQGVNQGEGRKDLRHAQPESAESCSACQAQGWAGLVMTRPGHCQHCSPCPVPGCHPPTARPTRGRGSWRSNEGFRASLPGPCFTSCPGLGPWTEPACFLQPQRGVFRALCLFRPTYHTLPNALSTSALAGPEGQSGWDWPHPEPAALPSRPHLCQPQPHQPGQPSPGQDAHPAQSQHKQWWAERGSPWPLALHPATE